MTEEKVTSLYENLRENLPDNSHANRNKPQQKKSTPDGKRAEKVVKGAVKTKKNEMRKLKDVFISEDVVNVKQYIIMDVLVPSIKKAIYEIIVGALDMSLYNGRGDGRRSTADKVSYRDYSSASRKNGRSYDDPRRTTSGYSYDDLIFSTRGEAEAVLARMDELMDEYQIVRVADMYDLAGVTGEHTDNKYGWTNIRNAKIERVRDGYRINMPRALPIG